MKKLSSIALFTLLTLSLTAQQNNGLPITLVNFAVRANIDYTVNVTWTTTMEANNNYFELQGSNDGANFRTEALIFSKYESGNSTNRTDYKYKIGALVSCGKNNKASVDRITVKWKYIRLIQVNKDNRLVTVTQILKVNNY